MPAREKVEPSNAEPIRPEGFREDPYERTEIYPESDYPSAEEAEAEVEVEMEPLPIDIPEPSREDVRWTPQRLPIADARPVQVAGFSMKRRRLVVINPGTGSDSAILLRDPTDSIWTGIELAGGEQVELLHNDSVWALCNSGESTTLSVVTEFAVVVEG